MAMMALSDTVFANAPFAPEKSCAADPSGIAAIAESTEPVILRGFVSDWPVVAAARQSDQALFDYLSTAGADYQQ